MQRLGVVKMVAVAVAAFAFTFSLVPLYRIACEKVFGIRLDNAAADAARYGAADVGARMVTVEFDGGVNSKLPWAFKPHQTRMRVRLGEQYETNYSAHNNSTRVVVGSATPSVAPARASGYFSKIECFCFTAQTLEAGETRDLPVRFIIDPALPADVNTITLSYTFFRNDVLTERALTASASAAAAPAAAGVPHSAL